VKKKLFEVEDDDESDFWLQRILFSPRRKKRVSNLKKKLGLSSVNIRLKDVFEMKIKSK
jgi:hypothetical protein